MPANKCCASSLMIQPTMNHELPQVSICCITYNHEPYIRACLEGVVMQKTTFPFEAVVHDDASTDQTATIIREYAAKYPSLIKPILQTENQYSKRTGAVREIMSTHLRGKYVAMCEGDDYWIDPLKLQRQVDYLEANPDCTMTFHNAFLIRQTENERTVRLFTSFDSDRDLTLETAVSTWVVPTASMVMRRELFTPPSWMPTFFGGDHIMILNALHHGRVHYLDTLSSVYRQIIVKGGTSASSRIRGLYMLQEMITFYEKFNEGTQGTYQHILNPILDKLSKERKYQRLIAKHKVFKYLYLKRRFVNFHKKFLEFIK